MTISAKDVQNLRQATGVGMMDAKRALEESDGDMEAAIKLLRIQGLASAEKRASRDASEGAVAVVRDGNVAAIVELRCETDFVAKSQEFVALADEIAAAVVADGDQSVAHFKENIEVMLTTLKENISIGRVYRLEAGPDEVIDTYQHIQANRGVNAVIVVVKDASEEVAHELTLHIAFAKPEYLNRADVPEADVEAERKTIEEITRNEGKPEAAIPKILEGRLNGWYKERVLLDQPYVQDDKETVAQFLKGATITAYAQVVIGG